MNLFTMGFTKKRASVFFDILRESGAKRVVDVRLNNVSQLAGFAKKDDLAYFLDRICNMGYVHLPELAPTKEMLDSYKKGADDWPTYEANFIELMRSREVEKTVRREIIDGGCLLCSEEKAHRCHRRLVAEYLNDHWGDIKIHHLG